MKYLKVYENYKTRNEVQKICKKYNIKNWTLRDDGKIDVDGNVNLHYRGLNALPLSFGHVSGGFYCSFNQLTTLQGAPQSVDGHFFCHHNQLTTLEGAPQSVEGDFDCSSNQLTTLEGAPKSVGGDFWCPDNKLTTLQGAPKSVEGDFNCHRNQLTTLKGAPKSVDGGFLYDIDNLTKYLRDFLYLNPEQEVIKSILKWQDEYKMYNKQGEFNQERFIQMMEDIAETDGIRIKFPA